MTNHLPVLPYRRHYILLILMKFCFSKTQLLHSNQAARQSQSHSSDCVLDLVGGILKSLSSQWNKRDNSEGALHRRLWQMEQWCTQECEIPWDILEMTVDVIFSPTHQFPVALLAFILPAEIHWVWDTQWAQTLSVKMHPVVRVCAFLNLQINILNKINQH